MEVKETEFHMSTEEEVILGRLDKEDKQRCFIACI